jgi:hypothetical protein
MKTKELIAILQKLDPTGEVDCTVDNVPIDWIERIPAYYDGKLQRLIFNEKEEKIGMKFCTVGSKIKIHTYDFEDLIADKPEAIMDISELNNNDSIIELIEKYRKESKEIWEQIKQGRLNDELNKLKDKG